MTRFGVVCFPGSNCDHDTLYVCGQLMGRDAVELWHEDHHLQGCDVIILPGGFAHGDYLRTGALASFSPIMADVRRHALAGGYVLGICNGFQILQESGLLPGAMLRNRGLKFICRHVHIRVERADTPFTCECSPHDILRIPVAHNEGCFYAQDEVWRELEERNQVIFRYCDERGMIDDSTNPNGSRASIAGICNAAGNVLGLMPHPERAAEDAMGGSDGRRLFESLCRAVEEGYRGL